MKIQIWNINGHKQAQFFWQKREFKKKKIQGYSATRTLATFRPNVYKDMLTKEDMVFKGLATKDQNCPTSFYTSEISSMTH